ncbi:isoleucine--tRNA ligase [Candidatus Magnetomonas plexicatena]|uniref:isoleucine--tRNA ligase n=1 Tax=Candidatus Magnetomonas plexicatena TaxID=2552947 RepID=UPI001C78FC53|nr:isoleucine--tRNA ligase [Nitrospirales bacterium LBB_01]
MANDFKDTLNLPETDFPMKANLSKRELEFLAFWKEMDVYQKMLERNSGNPPYVLHDGPPYANGHIHIGHALNKILKDIIVKFNALSGRFSPYVPGWDCHGLPIELQVDKNLGSKKHEVTIQQKRKLCREYADKFINIQRDEFMRLGGFGDWFNPYITMTYDYEAAIVGEFYKVLKSGYVYRGRKPVHWCSSCVTALAEAEVEYADKLSPSIYVKFKLTAEDAAKIGFKDKDVYIVIWTTTPWTLPANLALAVNPDVKYAVINSENQYFIAAQELIEKITAETGFTGVTEKTITGAQLEGLRAHHPFIERLSPVITGDFVTVTDGTGIVHIAPGHGEDDYRAGLKNGLDIYVPVDDNGKFTKDAGFLHGKFVFAANEEIIEHLKQNGSLIYASQLTHSYPHCWRCKKPVIFRATEQWFISMSAGDLKERCLNEIDNVTWVPGWGKDRIVGTMKNRPDWCISRQRAWGVPIAVFLCKECTEPVTEPEILERITSAFKEHSSDVWFDIKPEEFLPNGYVCKKCGHGTFKKETDILDVWFDSGVSHAAVLERVGGLTWPADMYLEGSDQHRGWFQSSLIAATATRGKAPFRTVLTHGFVVDGKGKKMSKSLGNVVAPDEVINKSGAEILRLWTSAEDYRNDVRISNEIMARLTEAYRKIRNTARFLLGNISDFDGADMSAYLQEIDKWAMSRTHQLVKSVTASYKEFEFHMVYHALHNFCIVDMSSFYLDIMKDRVYTFKKDSVERRSAQWVMFQMVSVMARLMAPILSFTAEEVWQSLRKSKAAASLNLEESVFLTSFPVVDNGFMNEELEARWAQLISVRNAANKALELKRQEKFIGNALEAKLHVYADNTLYSLLREYENFLPTLFIVSQASLFNYDDKDDNCFINDDIKGLAVKVLKADGQKCQRCWNYSETVGTFADIPEVCSRCHDAIN